MIRHERRGGLDLLTIDRQDKANSLTEAMLRELTAALDEIAARDSGAVILTGAGTVFSAGADLAEARAGLATSPEWERLSARVATMPCLTVAALNGTLAGGAFGMVLACDLRIAVPEARFFYPVMTLGFLPQPSDPRRMTRLIGAARAKMILMAGRKVEAAEALDWGLVDRVVPAATLIAEAQALAADCVAADPAHVTAIKAMVSQP
ncbi:enoyl-CoA hydratase/isomerase family protein [Paracoccus spongiarum]|uniref:Enoyl-CoA hydratase/isomerase family protein n=1 Tax=Paracoccus spongiarum TaxID=3064387 RepID=A0ABT9JB24_9RHOB|nr:enoyl-CoA hydratase/isomerase family protein [Paracoccus sp. 2205BS29-5]MDP5306997.1 enoyl-CoA hydratase/isomerase family protein [Paracoccus sp. 2205BS29-5]